MRNTGPTDNRTAMIGGLIIAGFLVLASDAIGFETDIWAGSTPASSAGIYVNEPEVGPVEGLPDTVAGWALISYERSVNCSPPRACYANSQQVYVYANCSTGAIKDIQRISMDLSGNVVAESGERTAYIPAHGTVDHAVVRVLCETYGIYYPRLRSEDR